MSQFANESICQFVNEPIYQSTYCWYDARVWAPPLKGAGGDVSTKITKSSNRQIAKSPNRQIISQTQAYSLPKTSPKTHTHQR